ncbi:uncharacterized protein LOC131996913 [Stomoxys calcitrans]|uniref:uncharacterized protein LOC131996913 n=1 Tax=Stomoxys calcitrans TaxID=35570 RepID=UPI0027E27CB5|nr:uncharacterized protein LOC131996913 [Stomoxys calcitrans]
MENQEKEPQPIVLSSPPVPNTNNIPAANCPSDVFSPLGDATTCNSTLTTAAASNDTVPASIDTASAFSTIAFDDTTPTGGAVPKLAYINKPFGQPTIPVSGVNYEFPPCIPHPSKSHVSYINNFQGLPISTSINKMQSTSNATMYRLSEHNFLSSTQINNGKNYQSSPSNNCIQEPVPIVEFNANNNIVCHNASSVARNPSSNILQPSLYFSAALTQPPIQTFASSAYVSSNSANFLSNPNMFDTTPIFSQPILSTAYAQPTVTSSDTFLNNNTQINNIVPMNVSMTSSQIAARHVMSKDLPIFSGRPEEWPVFITNYWQSTERCGFTNQENLIRLQKCLKGPALEAVRGKLMMPSTVGLAISTLQMLFGRPDVIHQTLQTKLREEPKVRLDNLNTLISLALAVQNYCSIIHAIGLNDYLVDPMLLNDLLSKLPSSMKLEWGRHSLSCGRVNLLSFDQWLFNLATCASQVTTFGFKYDDNGENKTNRRQGKERVMFHGVQTQNNSSSHSEDGSQATENVRNALCLKCSDEHKLANCPQFSSLKIGERWEFVRRNKLCFSCFGKHALRRCYFKKACGVDDCKLPHNVLLHENSSSQKPKLDVSKSTETAVLFHNKQQKVAVFRYVPITLYGKQKSINTWALIDEGAACTLMESEIAAELDIDGPSEELCLRWTGDISKCYPHSKTLTLRISSQDPGYQKYDLKNVRTIESLDLPEQSLEPKMIESCKYLRNLPLKPYSQVRPRMIIGLDNAKLGAPLEICESENSELMAVKCRLGWAVYGRRNAKGFVSNNIFHICDCLNSQQEAEKMDELMRHYFSLDAVGVTPLKKALHSRDDERALQIMETTTTYCYEEKRWQTGLLWRYSEFNLPNSFPMAMRRLKCLEGKMLKEPNLKNFLVDKIREYEEKGYVRKLKKGEATIGGKSWFIPIFTVTNINKNKTRLVWDAAAKVDDISLNTCLLKGPDLLRSLIGILLRFREKPIAVCGDIREMFHQIKIIKEDQFSQMFLWREGEPSREVDVYCMQVMTFGASCSPSLANYVKDKNANRFVDEYPTAVAAIIENTFVDDWLHSCETEEELIALATAVRDIHKEGGFEMRNWISNSAYVLESLTGKTAQLKKCIQPSEPEHEKILGMWWLPQTDEFTFIKKFTSDLTGEREPITKRRMLRVIMQIFDPLGFLGNYLIYAKIILQDVWRSGVSWDEPIKNEERQMWAQWTLHINSIGDIRIPRCYQLACQSQDIQLHVFVDASENAYAAFVSATLN